jgi:hypothetical protein
VQSLILASILMSMGFQTVILGFVADLRSVNRRLMEEIPYRSRGRSAEADPFRKGREG